MVFVKFKNTEVALEEIGGFGAESVRYKALERQLNAYAVSLYTHTAGTLVV